MAQDTPSDQPTAPLILALATSDVEHFVIIEGATTGTGRRQTPHAYPPMPEERLRAVLETDFGMRTDEIDAAWTLRVSTFGSADAVPGVPPRRRPAGIQRAPLTAWR